MKEIDKIIHFLEVGDLRENDHIELKSNITASNHDAVARAMVALANNDRDGYLIVGVVGGIKGISFKGVDTEEDTFKKEIFSIVGDLTSGINLDITWSKINGKNIAIIHIFKGLSTTYFSRKATSPEREIKYMKTADGKIVAIGKKSYKRVFKYMTIEAFLTSLYCKTWRFCEPSKWQDKYEQRFYRAKYTLPAAKGNTPQVFAACVTRNKNSEAAWKVYSHGQGLGAHCVQVELNIANVRNNIRKALYRFEERTVVYKDEEYITRLHKPSSKNYPTYFKPFDFGKYLDLLSLKRDAYTYEQEIRLFVIPDMNMGEHNTTKKAKSLDINVDWGHLINSVRVDKNCTPAEIKSIQQACYYVGINPVFSKKAVVLSGGSSKPKGARNVPFELFDIDDMPGGRITIK